MSSMENHATNEHKSKDSVVPEMNEKTSDKESEVQSYRRHNTGRPDNNDDYQDTSDELKPKNYYSENEEEYSSENDNTSEPETQNEQKDNQKPKVTYYQPINYLLLGEKESNRDHRKSSHDHSKTRVDDHRKSSHDDSETRNDEEFERYSSAEENDHSDSSHKGGHQKGSHRQTSNSRRDDESRDERRGNDDGSHHQSGGHDRRHRQFRKSRVVMPTGTKAYIVRPNTSGWKRHDKTKLITLNPKGKMGRAEYNIVANEMEATRESSFFCTFKGNCYSSYKIIKIQKIVNGDIWRKYRNAQGIIYDEIQYVTERMLFHGTNKIDELLEGGFDERYSNSDGRFGAGIYFAKNSSKSNEYAFGHKGACKRHDDSSCFICVRQMLLCRVTLGKVYQTAFGHNFSYPPAGYHSVEGTPGLMKNYPENVIFRGEQAYPEYLITYKIVK